MAPDGKPRLFRPDLNMARMQTSRERLALPPFDGTKLLELIKKLVTVDARWIPRAPGCSLYIRPTIVGTRPGFGVFASSSNAMLVVMLSPAGKMFKVPAGISLLAVSDHVRAWPGGTGGYKLGTLCGRAQKATKAYCVGRCELCSRVQASTCCSWEWISTNPLALGRYCHRSRRNELLHRTEARRRR